MFTVFIVIIAIIAVLLVLIVLVQNAKGGGLAGEFGGSGATQMFGVKRTTDLLEQITWGLAGAMALLALVSNLFIGTPQASSGINSVNVEKANSRSLPAAPAPTTPAPSTTPAPAQQQPAQK
ncbi:MAG: preprotein translocase subunit SecG [Spirosomataceae bacterium]